MNQQSTFTIGQWVFWGSTVLKKGIVSTFNHNPYSAKNTNNNMLLKRKKMVFRWRTNCKL